MVKNFLRPKGYILLGILFITPMCASKPNTLPDEYENLKEGDKQIIEKFFNEKKSQLESILMYIGHCSRSFEVGDNREKLTSKSFYDNIYKVIKSENPIRISDKNDEKLHTFVDKLAKSIDKKSELYFWKKSEDTENPFGRDRDSFVRVLKACQKIEKELSGKFSVSSQDVSNENNSTPSDPSDQKSGYDKAKIGKITSVAIGTLLLAYFLSSANKKAKKKKR